MIYTLGSNGNDVIKIQNALRDQKTYVGRLDGNFGSMTQRAVIKFQLNSYINADGVVGPLTWKLLLPNIRQSEPDKVSVPKTRKELYENFGDPLITRFWSVYGGFCVTPKKLNHIFTYQWQGQNGFWCHKYVIPSFQFVYSKIVEYELTDELKTFDGCFNIRKIRGGSQLSMHSWGIAVDHNASTNRLGSLGDISRSVVNCFIMAGFTWGGNFNRLDPMHFEFTLRGI